VIREFTAKRINDYIHKKIKDGSEVKKGKKLADQTASFRMFDVARIPENIERGEETAQK
jgi:hypothetical protein